MRRCCAILVALASVTLAGERPVEALIAELVGKAPPADRSKAQWEAVHRKVLEALLPRLSDRDPYKRQEAERTYRRICWRAARPGAEVERAAAAKEIAAKLRPDMPEPALLCLLEQLEHIGRDEAVETLAELLDVRDPNPPFLRERARRALLANPSPKALDALRRALAKAKEPAWQVGLINALGARRDKASVGTLIALARSKDRSVRDAAIEALARIGDKAAAAVIAQASRDASPREWRTAIVAYLLLADNLLAAGDRAAALELYKSLLEAEGHIRCGALIGAGKAGGPTELRVLLAALNDPDREVRAAAASALDLLPLETIRKAAGDTLKGGSAATKVLLLGLLGKRRDSRSTPTVLAMASDPDEKVRIAAYRALVAIGDSRGVSALLAALERAKGAELKTIEDGLSWMGGQAVTKALVAALGKAQPATKTEIIRILAARKDPAAVPALLTAARDPEPTTRREALKAIGAYAGSEALEPLVALMVVEKDPGEVSAAEKALAAVASRAGQRAAGRIIPALPKAPVAARCALVRVLARVGGEEALRAVRAAMGSGPPEVAEAAVRSLGAWPDPSPAPDLLEFAKRTKDLQSHVLALRGLLNLLSLEDGLPTDKKIALYSEALTAARRQEEKKAILGALAKVAHPRALALAESQVTDAQLRAEAALAAASVAASLIGSHPQEARAALRKLLENPPNDTVKNKAQDALNRIEKLEDYITAWQVAGPYTATGKGGPALHDVVFPPEKGGGEGVGWKVMPPGGGGEKQYPFLMDFYKRFKRDDDGAKVWLNGSLVINAPSPRSFALAADKVPVTLRKGWNTLLVKVWNGGSYWSAAARFRAPDGSRLAGLRASIEPK